MSKSFKFQNCENFSCSVPKPHTEKIIMGHGSGGVLTQSLIEHVFMKYFDSEALRQGNDSACLPSNPAGNQFVVSTDSHIVSPLFFPGGDIGRLAVYGTVNDVLTAGAMPRWLSAGFILEEGLPFDTLERVLASMQKSAEEAEVEFVTGDTKVVEHGKGDGIFINTTGIGFRNDVFRPDGRNAQPGDAIILTGRIAEHGLAVLCARGDFGITSDIQSDAAPLVDIVRNLSRAVPSTHVLRDPTRGGLSTTLNEIARQSGVSMLINEADVPISDEAASLCEMLGFDPFFVANEGKLIVIVPGKEKEKALSTIKNSAYGKEAAIIGQVIEKKSVAVLLKTRLGTTRVLDSLPGEMLPRIC